MPKTPSDAVELVLEAEELMAERNEPDCEFRFVYYRRKKFWLKLPGRKAERLAGSQHIEMLCGLVAQLVDPEFRLLDVVCAELETAMP